MRLYLAPSLLVVALLGCAEPSAKPERIQVGMTEEQVLGLMGTPTTTTQLEQARLLDYETFDQDRWFGPGRKENIRVFRVRLVEGRVASAGPKGEASTALLSALPAARASSGPIVALAPTPAKSTQVALPVDVPAPVPAATPHPHAAFDLRAELEKLEKLKKDGLISDAEFQDLRQSALKKAKQ